MSRYQDLSKALENQSSLWLITGVAGFIGSNLLEQLLRLNQKVVGLDDFSTGSHENLIDVKRAVSDKQWSRFRLIEGNIKELAVCKQACVQVDYVLHHAALGSVPISVDDPLRSNETNVTGFLNMLVAAQEEGVKRFVYAASSSTYGDHPNQPHVEDQIGKPLSPYAVTKYVNELYAEVFTKTYGFHAVGLRYFNVFGKRQSPKGVYAAVIPNWIAAMLKGKAITIFGDGLTSRDFCFIDDVVQANLLAALAPSCDKHEIYNVALGEQTSLLKLLDLLKTELQLRNRPYQLEPVFAPARQGDIKHSCADTTKACEQLGFSPQFNIGQGLTETINWFIENEL